MSVPLTTSRLFWLFRRRLPMTRRRTQTRCLNWSLAQDGLTRLRDPTMPTGTKLFDIFLVASALIIMVILQTH